MASQIFAVSPLLSVLSGAGLSSGVGSGAKRAWAGVGLGKHNAAIAAMITLQTTRMAFLLRAERFLRDIEPAALRSQVASRERARCRRRYRVEEKRDFSLRRPTHSQERMRKKKSACSVRNDRFGLGGGGEQQGPSQSSASGSPKTVAAPSQRVERSGL